VVRNCALPISFRPVRHRGRGNSVASTDGAIEFDVKGHHQGHSRLTSVSVCYLAARKKESLEIVDWSRIPTLCFSFFAAAIHFNGSGPTLRPPTVSPELLRQEAALQREFTYKLQVDRKIRLQRIYTPMRIANADGQYVSPVNVNVPG